MEAMLWILMGTMMALSVGLVALGARCGAPAAVSLRHVSVRAKDRG